MAIDDRRLNKEKCECCQEVKARVEKNEDFYMPIAHTVKELPQAFNRLQIKSTEMEQSLKSLHKRMDDDSVIRKEIHDVVINLATSDATKDQYLKDHMYHEEMFQKFMVGIVLLGLGFITWATIMIMESSERDTKLTESLKHRDIDEDAIIERLSSQDGKIDKLIVIVNKLHRGDK